MEIPGSTIGLEVHPEHLPKRLMIHKPMKIDGKVVWHTEISRVGHGQVERFAAIITG
ncbi:hypothetical protein X769_07675 [Mesorhizobium sp. LSJC268A00]|uniref:hypothetical protein n=1 Tax=unclassified Mesorhizobium TaxID=325217 RepID=UPI0003CF5E03|nr:MULTISPECIES: hypothetical protein [unclassified Mesorhizobium]ESW93822.1 hypothetical protein X770_01015 [Mesorhizobium sp. LSJC269B00]ESX27829.1 hypothetical protein X767_02650 [Mesorhizobium sp. LSJC264A00]ESX56225.1 hypothetical protein X761_12270 [Mesorhizobium sp. LSHC424B00]ESX73071.1 hypothetical protein X758_11600 [Mesorhizobium sp. LSHC416B00]ESX07229.1 hypothetical protein X769_07675 [Mesorhizobium sp. LSJC268A00]